MDRNSRERVEAIRKLFPAGTRIKLREMNAPYSPDSSGAKGIVDSIGDDGRLHMRCDNGRILTLTPGVDDFTILPHKIQFPEERNQPPLEASGEIAMLLRQNVRDWYTTMFPTDELGPEIRDITFRDLVESMNQEEDLSEIIGEDSIVRERVFDQTSKILQVDYDVIYYKWLYGRETPEIKLPDPPEQQQEMTMGGMSL